MLPAATLVTKTKEINVEISAVFILLSKKKWG